MGNVNVNPNSEEEHVTSAKKIITGIQELEIANHVTVTPKDLNHFNVTGQLENANVSMVSTKLTADHI